MCECLLGGDNQPRAPLLHFPLELKLFVEVVGVRAAFGGDADNSRIAVLKRRRRKN
jgi:hypothetical protein